MDSVAILFRADGVVLVGTQSGEILAMSDDAFDLSYAAKANQKVKSIDMRHDGLMSVDRGLLQRLEKSSTADARPVELSVRVQYGTWDYHVKASFVEAVGLWIVWGIQRTISR